MNELVVPFLTDDPMFTLGVEFGMLYSELVRSGERVVRGYYHRENQEQITLLANRLGWRLVEMTPHDEFWFFLVLEAP